MIIEAKRGETLTEAIDFVLEECCKCGTAFMIPSRMKSALLNSHNTFYCPNGHAQSYVGKSEAEKLRDKIALMEKDRIAEHEDLQNKWLDALGEKQKLEKKLKRVDKGVCPCCNRSFIALSLHMKTKHPEHVGQNNNAKDNKKNFGAV